MAGDEQPTLLSTQHASPSAVPSPGFQLTHVLHAHTSDVRSVATTYDGLSARETLLSGSRDSTASYWSRPVRVDEPAATFDKGSTFHGQRFCNAVSFIPPNAPFGLPKGQIVMGNLDSQIRCFDPLRADKPLQVLTDHWDNVSVIKSYSSSPQDGAQQEPTPPVFISGSWDKTARVWTWDPAVAGGRWTSMFVLRGHAEAVWGAQIVEPPARAVQEQTAANQGKYLTSSADLFIRLFHGEQLHAVYAGHIDVVRSLELLPILPTQHATSTGSPPLYPAEWLFATTSNDGTVRVWSLDPRRSPTPGNGGEALRVLRGHTSLVYDLAAYLEHATSNPKLVSSGEDGTFRVWNWDSAELLETVAVPATSVWCIAVLPQTQDVVVGCSDSLVRVYSRQPPATRPASDSNLGGPALSASEAAAQAAKAEQVQIQHSIAIQARQKPAAAQDQTKGQGEVFEGKHYDFVLRIDVSDDAEPLPLPINRADDRQQAALDFVVLHKLPESYGERIVEFIDLVLG